MARPLLLLRPQPGNDETAARARARGLAVVQVPLFAVAATDPGALPRGPFDALLLTSANGARFGEDALGRHAGLPLYAVGTASAEAARAAGHGRVIVGAGDAAGTAAMIARDGHEAVLHVCGADVRPFDAGRLRVARHIVYRVAETDAGPLQTALAGSGAFVAAVHSPAAGHRLASLIVPADRPRIAIAAISPAAAEASGSGWSALAVSPCPDDTALLRVAEALCLGAG